MLWQLLKDRNINYEELNTAERETLETWLKAAQGTEMTVQKVSEYLQAMKDAVANELATHSLPREEDIFLKARLKNYILLLAFLSTPDKAKKALEDAIKRIQVK
jgi:hypothetical protein